MPKEDPAFATYNKRYEELRIILENNDYPGINEFYERNSISIKGVPQKSLFYFFIIWNPLITFIIQKKGAANFLRTEKHFLRRFHGHENYKSYKNKLLR